MAMSIGIKKCVASYRRVEISAFIDFVCLKLQRLTFLQIVKLRHRSKAGRVLISLKKIHLQSSDEIASIRFLLQLSHETSSTKTSFAAQRSNFISQNPLHIHTMKFVYKILITVVQQNLVMKPSYSRAMKISATKIPFIAVQ